MVLEIPKQVNEVKEYLKQIEEEVKALADRVKLDGQIRWGLEDKFKKAYASLDSIKEPQKVEVKVAKVDMATGIKKLR